MALERVVVIGTGTMGHGIAAVCALGGLETVLCGRTDASVARGLERARQAAARLEALDGTAFRADGWERPEGGGGLTRVVEEGGLGAKLHLVAIAWRPVDELIAGAKHRAAYQGLAVLQSEVPVPGGRATEVGQLASNPADWQCLLQRQPRQAVQLADSQYRRRRVNGRHDLADHVWPRMFGRGGTCVHS